MCLLFNYYFFKIIFSRDGRTWNILAPLSESVKSHSFMPGLFTGEPSAPYTYSDYEHMSKTSTEPIQVSHALLFWMKLSGIFHAVVVSVTLQVQIREEDRLACFVRAVDAEGSLIPQGAYVFDSTGHIVPDPTYKGTSTYDVHSEKHLFSL